MEVSCYVAPWALPREEVPVHLMWDSDVAIDFIAVDLPQGVIVKQLYNVDQHETVESGLRIRRLKTKGFFGFTLATEALFDGIHLEKELRISFVSSDKVVYSKSLKAHFYRPRLDLVESPKTITIREEARLGRLLNITLRIIGFGRVNVSTDINIGGGFKTRPESLYRELVSRLITSFRDFHLETSETHPISIDHEWLEEQVQIFADMLNRGEVPSDIAAEDLEDFRKWVSDPANEEGIRSFLSRQMESILVDSLLFYFDRFPTDGVELMQGSPAMCIESATENVRIRFRYKDSMGNEYEPVEIEIRIDDKRQSHRERVELPINIVWQKETIRQLEGGLCNE